MSTNVEAEKILDKDNEGELLETFLKKIRPGDIVFDIGANIGLYTLPSALKLASTGCVFAFEPAPLWFQRLKENIAFNRLDPSRVASFNIGLSDKDEIREIVMKEIQGSGMGSVTMDYRTALDKTLALSIPVQLVRGDDFLSREGIPRPNIVKIDVEGAELEVLLGLEKAFRDTACRYILCEVHPQLMPHDSARVEQLLKEYGYEIRINEWRRSEYHIQATRPAVE